MLFAARARRKAFLAGLAFLMPTLARYAVGKIERRALKEAIHCAALGTRLPKNELEKIVEDFLSAFCGRFLYPLGVLQIQTEQNSGRRVWIATAAPEIYAKPLGKLLGVDRVIGTQNIWDDGHLTSRIADQNCYGQAKLTAIQEALKDVGIDRRQMRIRFYSDDASDLPTFEWADVPIAANPNKRLRKLAEERGWQIVSFA